MMTGLSAILFSLIFLSGCKAHEFGVTEVAINKLPQLTTTCHVWGVLKYYAPLPSSGEINWDEVLITNEPELTSDLTKEKFNEVIYKMISDAGVIYPDPLNSNTNTLFSWIHTDTLLNLKNKELLIGCINRKANNTSYYAISRQSKEKGYELIREKSYPDEYPSRAHRLIAFSRYWNVINYLYPYKDGLDWASVIDSCLIPILNARNAEEYQLRTLNLCMRIKDSHSATYSPFLYKYFGRARLPIVVTYCDSQTIIVWYDSNQQALSRFPRGTIIDSINGVPIKKVRSYWAQYVQYSNDAYLQYSINSILTIGKNGDSALLSLHYKDTRANVYVKFDTTREKSNDTIEKVEFHNDKSIAYVRLPIVTSAEFDSIFALVKDSKGLIFDMRAYPQWIIDKASSYLMDSTAFALFKVPVLSHPGKFKDIIRKTGGRRRYFGKVVILVNEYTLSQAEFTCMALRQIPNSTIIGSQTAGADGDVSVLELPGLIRTKYSGIGVCYPDGTPTQRIGIVPDIYVTPTLDDIVSRRNVYYRKAVDYLKNEIK